MIEEKTYGKMIWGKMIETKKFGKMI